MTTSIPEQDVESLDAIDLAQETLVADIRDYLLQIFKDRKKPWEKMSQGEQQDLVNALESQAGEMVSQALEILTSHGRTVVFGKLAGGKMKKGHASGLEFAFVCDRDDRNLLALGGHIDSRVAVVICDRGAFDRVSREVRTNPDQPTIFDQEASSDHMLVGCSVLPSMIETADGRTIQLGEIVAEAHTRSGFAVEAWNNLSDEERNDRCMAVAEEWGYVVPDPEFAEVGEEDDTGDDTGDDASGEQVGEQAATEGDDVLDIPGFLRRPQPGAEAEAKPNGNGSPSGSFYRSFGVKAAQEGEPRDACPFPEGSDPREQWLAGWDAEAGRVAADNAAATMRANGVDPEQGPAADPEPAQAAAKDPAAEGRDAYARDKKLTDCPYDKRTKDGKAWCDAWKAAAASHAQGAAGAGAAVFTE